MPTVANVLLSNAHRKKVIHNLVYRHDDFPAASAAWGSLFPQTFCIDEDAGHILTISDPGVVSIYDWDTGAYLRCFRIAGKSALSQCAVIRRIGSKKWLYLRYALDTMARVDITTLPANMSSVSPSNTYSFPLHYDFDWRNDVWTTGTRISNYGDTNFQNRARFIRRDNDFSEIGLMELPTMRYGGNVGVAQNQYMQSWIPKSQGFAEGPNCYAIGMGGAFHPDNIPAGGETLFHMQGIRVFNTGGELMAESLVQASAMLQTYTDLGLNPSYIECEGVEWAFDNFYTLNTINRAADAGSAAGGFVIQQEFVDEGTPGAFDVSEVARGYPVPTTQTIGAGLQPVGDDLKLRNQVTWERLTTLPQALALMQSTGQHRMAFYTPVANLTDIGGAALPANSFVEIINLGNLAFDVRISGPRDTRKLRVTSPSPTGAWASVPSDTGWVNLQIASGYAAISSGEHPKIRLKDGVLYFRGGWSNTGLTASAVHDVGTVPSSFTIVENILIQGSSSNGASDATVRIATTRSIQIRTGTSVGSYYKIDGASVPVD
ncbi:MAG: hypothetical protein J0H23_00420 [Micrococcales bacterium]|nr:hypothetical protein [Micrococcales bacterium]OJX66816.1 MAG: hypothetical protein BGO94_08255 [Micrococcales bacterium 72-143]